MNETIEGSGKDRPLRDDIRLLGRILGDTVREQEGEAVFDIVERIRQTSIRFHRDNDEAARHALEAILNDLSPGQTVQIVRAFSYFSHLANIAEDQHHIRRTRAHTLAGAAPRAGTIAHAIDRAQDAGIGAAELGAFFDKALVSPVLTAHPTEVRRKSTLDREIGQIKQGRGFRQFLMRGIEKVRAEWAIICTTHNMLKLAQGRSLSAARPMALEARPAVA
jgi:phosphoenolpyruvate carboxylase